MQEIEEGTPVHVYGMAGFVDYVDPDGTVYVVFVGDSTDRVYATAPELVVVADG